MKRQGGKAMKEFVCGSLVPGCDFVARHGETAEVIRKTVEHLRTSHGRSDINETTIEAIRSRIETASVQKA
jgi:predicted small metal-binding protein